MIKFILKKTAFKDYDKETQNRLILLLSKKYTTQWFCCFIFHLIFIAPMILLYFSVRDKELDSIYNIILGSGILLYGCLWAIFYSFFYKEILKFSKTLMPTKLYATLYTKKGNAISKNDFNTIEQKDAILYQHITSALCSGYCYSICFAILKTLTKGDIKFVAVKKLAVENRELEPYTMHVLYVYNDWAFDTFSQRQYPLAKIIELHEGIIYKNFSHEDINGLTYKEFAEKNYNELSKWCKENNCYQNWNTNDD